VFPYDQEKRFEHLAATRTAGAGAA
jgi:hypothetical protein